MGSWWSSASNKFDLVKGMTLFGHGKSSASRRVRITLLEKGIEFKEVDVNLLYGQQLYEKYACICPNKKIPAISFIDVPGVENCWLFESYVITEFLDEDAFPGPKLYPRDTWGRAQVKMWQDWELGLSNDHTPLVYRNGMAVVLQVTHMTKESFLNSLPEETSAAKREYWARVYDGALSTPEELKQHAVACYQRLVQLEKALEGREYLVGDRFTAADISVLPRLSAYYSDAGLIIPESCFPNVVAYLDRLESHPSIQRSNPYMYRMISKLVVFYRDSLTRWVNWMSGRNLQPFDTTPFLDQALSTVAEWKYTEAWQDKVKELEPNGVLLTDCPVYPECWQVKLLLNEKGLKYTTLKMDAQDVLGNWLDCGIVRIHHSGHDIVGIRALMDYLDANFAQDTCRLLPENGLQRAKVLAWQAWDYTLGCLELGPLLEIQLIHKFLTDRYLSHLPRLDALKTDPSYRLRFPAILKCFIYGLVQCEDSSDVLAKLKMRYEDVTEAVDAAKNSEYWRMLLQDRLKYLETELQRRDQYLECQTLTLADIAVFCRLCFMDGLGLLNKEQNQRVVQWFLSLKDTRPHFSVMSKEIAKLFQ